MVEEERNNSRDHESMAVELRDGMRHGVGSQIRRLSERWGNEEGWAATVRAQAGRQCWRWIRLDPVPGRDAVVAAGARMGGGGSRRGGAWGTGRCGARMWNMEAPGSCGGLGRSVTSTIDCRKWTSPLEGATTRSSRMRGRRCRIHGRSGSTWTASI